MSEQREQQNVDGQADGDAQITDLPDVVAHEAESVRGGGTSTTTTTTSGTGKVSMSNLSIMKVVDRSSP